MESILIQEAQQINIKNQDYLVPCPRCRRYVDEVSARSIFDFNVKICKRCGYDEKVTSNFNWVKEIKD